MIELQTKNHKRQTIAHWLQENTAKLQNLAIESARLDCLLLLEFVLEKPRDWLFAHDDELLTDSQSERLDACAKRRADRIPLAYITGSKEFYGRTFSVTENTLIPRPESEAIIEMLRDINIKTTINTVIDVGTGSGILAITAKLEFPDIHVSATDVSPQALTTARKNAKHWQTHINFKLEDFKKDGLPKMPKTRPYVILANLPYVPRKMITSPEILKEPGVALFSGEDGLDHYRAFWQHISDLNNKPLAVITESLASQHRPLESMAKDANYKLEKTTDLIQLFTWSDLRTKI